MDRPHPGVGGGGPTRRQPWWIGLQAGLVLPFPWGIGNLVVAMLPMRFLDGPKVRAWSRPVWGVLLFLGILAVVHVLLSPNAGYVGHTMNEVTLGVLVIFAIFGAVSVGTWAYFRSTALGRSLTSDGCTSASGSAPPGCWSASP